MTLDELHDLWDADCKINDDHLDRESVRTPNLHSKYLRFLIQHKMKLSALETEYKLMRARKFRYYRGEMGKNELEELNWTQWQGVKPLKNEMEEFLDGDSDLNKITIKCAYIKNMIEAIEWKKFVAGS